MPQLIPSALRVMQVFELFSKERRPLSNSEIAKALNLAESSCSDLLYTLRQAGYLLRMPSNKKVQPTSRLAAILESSLFADPLAEFVNDVLLQLTKSTGETSMCGCLENNAVKVIACHESPKALRYVLKPGTILDVQATSLGKALLSIQSDEDATKIMDKCDFKKIASETITNRDVLKQQIEIGKQKGVFTSRNEGTDGVYAIAFPCYIGDKQLAFTLVGPVHRFEKNLEEYSETMLKIKTELFS